MPQQTQTVQIPQLSQYAGELCAQPEAELNSSVQFMGKMMLMIASHYTDLSASCLLTSLLMSSL